MISISQTCRIDSAPPAAAQDIRHVTAALGDARIETSPFPHALVEDFLPADLFVSLRDMARVGTGPGWHDGATRRSLFLTQSIGEAEGITDTGRRTLSILSSAAVVGAARDLFADHLSVRAKPEDLIVGLELMLDKAGFMLPPHTDGGRRDIGCLIYLAEADDPETMGTRLYAPIDPTLPERTRNGVRWEEVTEAASAPFRPNLALIWARSNASYHGVPFDVVDRDRRALQWCIERTVG